LPELGATATEGTAEVVGRTLGVVGLLFSVGSGLAELRMAQTTGQFAVALSSLAGGVLSGLGGLLGLETAAGMWLTGYGAVIQISLLVGQLAYQAYCDAHYGTEALAQEAYKRRLALCSPYVNAADQRLFIATLSLARTGGGGATITARTPATMPSAGYLRLLEWATESNVFVVMRLPHQFASGDSPTDGRYEREDRGAHGTARIPLAQGSTPAAGQPFMFTMANGAQAGTFTFTYEPRAWTLLHYHHPVGGNPDNYVADDSGQELLPEEYEIANAILTAPENLTKAIPVVFEVFVGGSNDANLATGRDPVGSEASAGITEVVFLKRTSASLDAPMELIDHDAAVAAGIVEVTLPAPRVFI
jgi:hypothetical protein